MGSVLSIPLIMCKAKNDNENKDFSSVEIYIPGSFRGSDIMYQEE